MSENSHSFEDFVEDYATTPVPENISVSGFRISLINTGLTFSLPGLVTGMMLGNSIGLYQSLVAFLIGGLILAMLGTITGIVGVRNRISSYMLIGLSFGDKGSKVVNLCIALSMFGWFGVNVDLFGDAGAGLWESLGYQAQPAWYFILIGGFLMTSAAIVGFKSIQKISVVIVPMQIIIFAMLVFNTANQADISVLSSMPSVGDMSTGEAISAVVGSFVVAALVMPDFTRYGKTTTDAAVASFVPYLCFSTLVYTGSAFAAIMLKESEVLGLLLAAGLGVMAFAFVIFSSTITNAVNLYGCSLSIAAIFPKWKEWHITLLSGAIGTAVAFAGVLDNFVDFIFSLGVIFSPVAAIYVTDFFFVNKGKYPENHAANVPAISWPAMFSWCFGIFVAYISNAEIITLTTISACDSFVVSMLVYTVMMKLITTKKLAQKPA